MSDLSQRLGQYEITAILGKGGMATVYQATQTSMNRAVAIKVIKPDLAEMADFMARFEHEARLIASLSHPYILKVFDYGQQDDLVYFVMELLPGGSLADVIRPGPLPLTTVNQILTQVGSALDYAHKLGIIHRDLKPQNVLLDSEGNAHLSDFGIAKVLNETSALTRTGMVMGTPTYMPPEQWQGAPLDARADMYSLGVMLFEMLTGTQPFIADTPAGMMYKHLEQSPPPVRDLRAELPASLDAVVSKALSKDPAERYPSVATLSAAFQGALAQKPVPPPISPDLTARNLTRGEKTVSELTAGLPVGRTATQPPVPASAPPHPEGRRSVLLGIGAFGAVLVIGVLLILFIARGGQPPAVATTATLIAANSSPVAAASSPTSLPPTDTTIPPSATSAPTLKSAPVVVPATPTALPTLPPPSATSAPTLKSAPVVVAATPTALPTLPPPSDTSAPTLTPTPVPPTLPLTLVPPTATVLTATFTASPTETLNPATRAAGTLAALGTQTANAQASFTATSTPNEQETINAIVQGTQTAISLTQTASVPTSTAAPTLTQTVALVQGTPRNDSQGVAQVWVQAGCFQMGSAADKDISPQIRGQAPRQVCLTSGYWIDKYEVSNADYQKFVDAGGYQNQAYWTPQGWQWIQANNRTAPADYNGQTDPDQPRVGITLYEAEAYAKWRGGSVPTEAQWEYAARGPNSFEYPWGNTFQAGRANIMGVAGRTVAVTMYDNGQSWVGAYNMAGNAGELVSDCFNAAYDQQMVQNDPVGACDGTTEMVKGSSFEFNQVPARSAFRFVNPVAKFWIDVGVRVISPASP